MAKIEYITTESYYAQILWIKQQLIDFEIELKNIFIRCDNTSAINLIKNPIQHSRSKYIEIRHHFIREHVQNNDVVFEYINTEKQLVDIFTKALNKNKFYKIKKELGIFDLFAGSFIIISLSKSILSSLTSSSYFWKASIFF